MEAEALGTILARINAGLNLSSGVLSRHPCRHLRGPRCSFVYPSKSACHPAKVLRWR